KCKDPRQRPLRHGSSAIGDVVSTTREIRKKGTSSRLPSASTHLSPGGINGEQVPQEVVLSAIAHDMRRHLTPIIGVSQTLLTHESNLADAQPAAYVNLTHRNALQRYHPIAEMIYLPRS